LIRKDKISGCGTVTKILNGGEGLSDELINGASHLFILLLSFHLMVLSSYFLQNYVYLQSFLCLQALNSLICVLNLFLTGMTEACSSMTFMPINKLELQETNNKSSNKSGGICV
jgi:acyl-activating enzyme 14